MYKEGSRTVKSNDAFEGYTIDLIKSVAEVLGMRCTNKISSKLNDNNIRLSSQVRVSSFKIFTGFNYTFKWVDDENYGKRNQETGEWNGMIGELLSQV